MDDKMRDKVVTTDGLGCIWREVMIRLGSNE